MASVRASQINFSNGGGTVVVRCRPSDTEVSLNEKQVGWSLDAVIMRRQ